MKDKVDWGSYSELTKYVAVIVSQVTVVRECHCLVESYVYTIHHSCRIIRVTD
jgi:hypothetical protein